MRVRCTSCGSETSLRRKRGFRLSAYRCSCGGEFLRVVDDYDPRLCKGDAYEPLTPRHHARACYACAKSVYQGGKCAPRGLMLLAEEWETEREQIERRLRGLS